MDHTNRRTFLKTLTGTLALTSLQARSPLHALSANERVILGVVGINGRGMQLAQEFARMKDVEVRYFADPDSRLFNDRSVHIESITGQRPACIQDYRRILDDPEVNGVIIATPDHWHALVTIHACQAGKDVYVEKPVSHNIREGNKMIEAARKYNRVVTVGTQNRSAEYIHHALDMIRSRDFGEIHFIRILNSKIRGSMEHKEDTKAPEGVDYDLWLGPAPLRPFNENHFHYRWHWFWNYGGGDLTNDGIHQVDLARWIAQKTYPRAVTSSGGVHMLNDDRETPDTQVVTWEFDRLTMMLEETLWTPYMTKTPLELRDRTGLPNWPFNGTRVELYGSRQFMYLGRMGDGWQLFDSDGKEVSSERGQYASTNTAHARNFIDCIRSRNRPNADIDEGHLSTSLTHYGNIAYRLRRHIQINPSTGGISSDPEAESLLARSYRKGYEIPDTI